MLTLDKYRRAMWGNFLLAMVAIAVLVVLTLKQQENKLKKLFALGIILVVSTLGFAQAPSAFPSTTVSFNLSPISLPGAKTSVAGAETDVLLGITPNNVIGETSLISGNYSFIGGRYNRIIPQFSKWLDNVSPTLSGYSFQLGLTASLGVVRTPFSVGQNQSHWGERAGVFLNYAVNGTFGLGFETQWTNLPGYAHSTYSIAFGPNFHFAPENGPCCF